MNGIASLSVVVRCLVLCVASTCVIGVTLDIKITHGSRNPICREVAGVIRGARTDDVRGKWRDYFDDVKWHKASYPSVAYDGHHVENDVRYSYVDIDNDGVGDVVVIQTDFFTSIYWDHLYKTSEAELSSALQEGAVGDLLDPARSLDSGNVVTFSNGVWAVPVELHVWPHKGEALLLMIENHFASDETETPNAMLVGRLPPPTKTKVSSTGGLTPELICRITAIEKAQEPRSQ